MLRIALAVLGIVVAGGSAVAGPTDLFAQKVNDFGTVPRGPVLVHYFRFTNTTNQTLTLGQPRVSCGCTSAAMSSYSVAPGETAAVIAHMDTRRFQYANITKAVTIYVPFYGPTQEEVSLRVQAICRDDLMMSPDTLAFGSVTKGKGAKVSTQVTFTSDPNWEVKESKSTGGYIGVSHKLLARSGSTVTYDITATLDKDCPAGNWTADVFLKTSNAAVEKLRIPVTVNVTSPVAASPEVVQFGNVAIGNAAEKKVTLQSRTPFKILAVKGGDDQLGIIIESKDAKAVHVIKLSANPKLQGGFVRNVEITTDNKEQPKVVIPVAAKVVLR